jgi:hypothetical protein
MVGTAVPLSHLVHRRRAVILMVFLAGAACTPWALIVVTYVFETIAVDRCLDSGGSFDYSRMVCDNSRNHPYVSFEERHQAFVRSMHYLGVGLMASVATVAFLLRNPRSAS